MLTPSKCFISKSVNTEDLKNLNESKILNNIQEVSVKNNCHLNAIIDSYKCWNSMPTIFIDSAPYKIKILKSSSKSVEMLQMFIKIYYKANGKPWYKILNKRKVIIHFL